MNSQRTLQALTFFGLTTRDLVAPAAERARARAAADAAARDVLARLVPGHIALVTGPSGGGKSTLLRAITRATRSRSQGHPSSERGFRPVVLSPSAAAESLRPVIDCMPGPLDRALALLATCGLADATILARPARVLSAGQHARLELARALARVETGAEARHEDPRHALLICDEFASVLDRAGAMRLASSIRRIARHARCAMVLASAHDDLLEPLAPDLLIVISACGDIDIINRGDNRETLIM